MPIHPDREPKMSKKERLALTYTISVLALLVLALLDLHVGAVKLSSSEIFQALTGTADSRIAAIVNSLRLPRLLTAILAGIGLAMSGSVISPTRTFSESAPEPARAWPSRHSAQPGQASHSASQQRQAHSVCH